jgi:murein L,D-transpeptidase YcbB/YkuD
MSRPLPPATLTRRTSLLICASALITTACGEPAPSGGAASLGARLSDPAARKFYAARSGQAVWDDAKAKALAGALAASNAHGLDHHDFMVRPAAGFAPDEALTLTALAYAKALASGLTEPSAFEPVFTLERNDIDLAAGLGAALERDDLVNWLASLAPADPEYKAISAAYLAAAGQPAATAGQPLSNDAPATNAPANDALSNDAPADNATNSLPAGAAGASASPQTRQLAANLERRRWLSRGPPAHRIDVNTAAAFLDYIAPGQPTWMTRTVVGRRDHRTPCIQADFHRLVVNPPWKVPKEIAAKEIFPKGPRYMAREDMRVVNGAVEQAPGRKCALGLVKFDVDDRYDIYLHDTPAKTMFALPDRHRSHGCVRVEHAVDFARSVAAETGKGDDFDQALATKETHELDLGQSIGVRLLYHTAYLDPQGRVMVAPDVYGGDDRLAAALGFGPAGAASAAAVSDADFGP